MAGRTFTVTLNEIHAPSVSFLEVPGEGFLASTTLNGKLYLTKDFLREIKWEGETDELEVTISKKSK